MTITIIAGARPNFMKVAPIVQGIENAAANGKDISYRLVHTGQHYDKNMSGSFFNELGIPQPNVNLECGGGSQAEQTANIMVAFEKELIANPADLVMVVGDVTSTMACSIVAKKLHAKVVHVEAGIRSNDLTMPEEINRMVTDAITDYFFTTTPEASQKLLQLGAKKENIHFVGNVMIDTLLKQQPRFQKPEIWEDLGLKEKQYLVITLHRPANVDKESKLKRLMQQIVDNVEGLPVVFPVHPRTARILKELGITAPNLYMVEPLGYLAFNFLVKNAKGVLTDSGGITEETTVMGVPCLTLRDNTERPETIHLGTNELIGANPENIAPALKKLMAGEWKKGGVPELWDGKSAERIVEVLLSLPNEA